MLRDNDSTEDNGQRKISPFVSSLVKRRENCWKILNIFSNCKKLSETKMLRNITDANELVLKFLLKKNKILCEKIKVVFLVSYRWNHVMFKSEVERHNINSDTNFYILLIAFYTCYNFSLLHKNLWKISCGESLHGGIKN